MSALNMGFAQLQIVPVMTGFNKTIKQEISGAFPALGKAAGADFGKAVGQGFSAEKKSLESEVKALEKNLASAQDNLKKAKGDKTRATEKETDALKKLEIAELKLAEVRNNSKAKASQLAQAEENVRQKQVALTKAQDESHRSAIKLENSTEDLTKANSQLVDANKKLKSSTDEAGNSSEKASSKYSKGWRGLGQKLKAQMSGGVELASKDAEKKATAGGQKAGSGFASGFKKMLGPLTAAVSVGAIVGKGWNRLTALDDARAKLKGLGNDAASVEQIMANANAAVSGTAFGMDAAATTAAGAVAAGIKPGKELESMLKGVANSAAAAGVPMEEMGSIWNKVATSNKAQMDVINQVNDKGIPLTATLAKRLGVTAAEAEKMASAGKIGFAEFSAAMTEASGTVADEAGKTATGSLKNFMAAIGRFGANLMDGVFQHIGPLFQDITASMKPLEDQMKVIGEKIGNFIGNAIQFFKDLVFWIRENQAWLGPLTMAIIGMVAAFKGIMFVSGVITGIRTAFALLNTTMLANPFVLIAVLIAGLVTAFIYLWNTNETFRNKVIEIWTAIKGFFVGIWENGIKPIFSAIGDFITNTLVPIFQWFYQNVILPVWNAIKIAIAIVVTAIILYIKMWVAIWQNVLAPAIKFVWEKILKPVFQALGTFFVWVWNTLLKPAFNALKTAFQAVGTFLKWVWEKILKPVFNTLGTFFRWVWENYLRPAFNNVKSNFEAIGKGIKWVWDNVLKPVFQTLGNFITDKVVPAFKKGVDFIKEAWDKVKAIAAKPINFVIDTVYEKGLRKTFNGIADTLKLPKEWRLPEAKKVPEFYTGGYTGPGGKYDYAGDVHAGEYVLRKEATSKLRRTFGLAGLDHMNKFGSLPGYSSGGLVRPLKGGTVTSRFGQRWGRLHAGIDFATPIGTPIFAAMDGRVKAAKTNAIPGRTGIGAYLGHDGGRDTYYGHLSRLLVSVGDIVKKGQQIALSGNTGNSTGPHLHFETHVGGKPVNPEAYLNGAELPTGGSSGGWNPLQALFDLKDTVFNGFKDKFSQGGMISEIALAAGKNLLDGPIEWIKEKAAAIGDFGQDVWGNVKDFFNGKDSDVQSAVRSVAAGYGWDSGRHWNALSSIIGKESSWNPNAQNKTSTAYGLFQFLNSTWAGVGARKTSNPTGQTIAGLKYIKNRYGDPEKAWAFHKRNNWYANGGYVDVPTKYDNGGWLQPGRTDVVNLTKKPEAIFTSGQWKILSKVVDDRMSGTAQTVYNIEVPEPNFSAQELATTLSHKNRSLRRG